MATFQELMRAAVNADAAGDTEAAAQLVNMAQSLKGKPESETFDPNQIMVPTPYDPSESVATPKVDRFGDTIKDAIKGPMNATKAYAGGLADQGKSPTMQSMPDWVPDSLRAPAAFVGDAAMTGLGAAGTAYAFGAGLVGEAFGGTPTNERKLARDLMMAGEVAVPELAGVSSVGMAAGKAAKASSKLNAPPTDVQRTARSADDLGITPSLGAGGKMRSSAAAGLEKVPGSTPVIAKDAQRFVGEVESAFAKTTAKVGRAASAVDAGEALQGGLDKFVTDFKAKSTRLFDDVGTKIPKDTVVQSPETVGLIRETLALFEGKDAIARELGLNKWAGIADDLEGGLTWDAAKKLRTSIGESIGKINGPLANMDQGKLKQVYSALTKDLEAAAVGAGPDAEKAWRRANNYYKRGATIISDSLDKTISAKSPERAYEAFAGMLKADATTADIQRVYKIKAAIPREEWSTVAASIVQRLGQAPKGAQNAAGDAFSARAFLTNWNKMSNEAKKALLPPEVRVELKKLADVAEGVKRSDADRNFSNTGHAAGWIAAMFGTAADAGMTAAALGGSHLSARALTSRPFLSALNRAARGDTRELRVMANGNGPFSIDAKTVLRMAAADAAQGSPAANSVTEPVRKTAR